MGDMIEWRKGFDADTVSEELPLALGLCYVYVALGSRYLDFKKVDTIRKNQESFYMFDESSFVGDRGGGMFVLQVGIPLGQEPL
ncbi:hypothetical protein C5167_001439 [Papaver somniferum]|uniref:Uncharacterized protein n=1 Tax=Papaver somniferum TaxID=3469 RepID=A0A4Y7KXX1_PAPSO|nr:hypothetical protein C5167_001439 [Papaver somniferum]